MKKKLLGLVSVALLSSGIYAQAGTNSSPINMNVPWNTTVVAGTQLKSHSSRDGIIHLTLVTNDVSARLNAGGNGVGIWQPIKNPNQNYNLSNGIPANSSVDLELKSDFWPLGGASVQGSWKSN